MFYIHNKLSEIIWSFTEVTGFPSSQWQSSGIIGFLPNSLVYKSNNELGSQAVCFIYTYLYYCLWSISIFKAPVFHLKMFPSCTELMYDSNVANCAILIFKFTIHRLFCAESVIFVFHLFLFPSFICFENLLPDCILTLKHPCIFFHTGLYLSHADTSLTHV